MPDASSEQHGYECLNHSGDSGFRGLKMCGIKRYISSGIVLVKLETRGIRSETTIRSRGTRPS